MFGLKLKILSKNEETKQKLNKYYWIYTPEELKKIDEETEDGINDYNDYTPLFEDNDTNFHLASELSSASQENWDKVIKNLDLTKLNCKYRYYRCQDIESSGLDIIMPENITIPAKSYGFKIKLGIACEPIKIYNMDSINEPGYKTAKCGYYLYPRSSLSKTPLRLANSVGIIDSSYRGELKAVLDNKSGEDYEIKQGERLFQLCSPTLEPINYIITDELTETKRGEGGFGSTGK